MTKNGSIKLIGPLLAASLLAACAHTATTAVDTSGDTSTGRDNATGTTGGTGNNR